MINPHTIRYADTTLSRPGLELRWPASVLWRPGEPAVNRIGLASVRHAILQGIEDFSAVPTYLLFLPVIYALLGLLLFRLSFGYELLPLIYPILTGLVLLGPLVAVVLYELSRRRSQGLDVSLANVFDVFRSPNIGAIVRLGLVLLAIFAVWVAVAQAMYTQTIGGAVPGSLGAFARQMLTTPAGQQLILIGNAVGFLFAVLVLTISVVSFPMLVDRNVSAATAVRTSIRAVIASPLAMAVWGLIVVSGLILGSLPLFFGLAIIFPVLGHATWHLYRKAVSPDRVI